MRELDRGGQWELVPNWVVEAMAFHADGRPLGRVRSGRSPEGLVDPMDPVVIAFQGMIQDRLADRGRPVSAVYGERVLSLVPGRDVHVATVVRGRPDRELRTSMAAAVASLESRWGAALRGWSGDPRELEGLAVELTPVVGRTADRGPGEVEDPMVSRGVFPASATDYEGGRARLKVGVFSAGFVALSGGFLELTYGRDTLRLEGSQPPHALSAEGTVRLPVVAPGEAGSVACLFEPLVPGRHLLEATLTFYDDANNPRHMEVPSREFEVAFPRLALETPPGSLEGTQRMGMDEARRCWRYPASLGGLDVLRTARTVLGTRGLVLTPGEEVPGPPPEWSVEGRALAGPSPLVLGIRVTGGEARRLELRVASPSGSVTAGAVAEMRKLMLEAFFKRWRGQVELEEEPTGPAREPDIPPTDIDIYVPAR